MAGRLFSDAEESGGRDQARKGARDDAGSASARIMKSFARLQERTPRKGPKAFPWS
jgi:hypothetical protein